MLVSGNWTILAFLQDWFAFQLGLRFNSFLDGFGFFSGPDGLSLGFGRFASQGLDFKTVFKRKKLIDIGFCLLVFLRTW
jgi:hypothetical protein